MLTRKGFTLLEVLIVVIIVGLLAAIALPQYANTLKKAKAGEAYANLGAIRTSMDRYYYDKISMGDYIQLTNTTLFTDLDIEIDTTTGKWTYTVVDTGTTSARNYVIQAEHTADATLWAQIDENGTFTKCTALGGDGTKVTPE